MVPKMASHDICSECQSMALLPVLGSNSGQAIFSAKTSAGRLLILQKGAAAIVKEAIEIAGRSNPGTVFGELFARQSWTGTVECSEFQANDAAALPNEYTIPLILVTTVLAQPIGGSHLTVRSTSGFQAGESGGASSRTVDETQKHFTENSGNLVYAGYPYDPYK